VIGAADAARLRPPRTRKPIGLGGGLLGAVGAALVVWSLAGFVLQYAHTYALARDAARLERRRLELQMANATLRAEIERLRTDDQYLEQLAREQLGMLKPGEMELVIVPETVPPHPLREREPRMAPPAAGREDRWEFVRGLAAFTLRGLHDALARLLRPFPRTSP
jgi:cell division protein FtsB